LFIGNVLYLADFKTGEIGSGRYSKALGAALKVCYPIGAEDLKLPKALAK
jgi:hypothetical protein